MNDLSDIFDYHKKSIVKFIDGVRSEAYRKGRADAIDEFLATLVDKSEYFSVGNKVAESSFILNFIKIAEQLKGAEE